MSQRWGPAGQWGKVPREVMTDHRLSLGSRALFAFMATHADGASGRVGALSVRAMADGLGVSPGTAQHHLGPLVELGHVLVERAGGPRSAAVYWMGWGCPQARDLSRAESRTSARPVARSARRKGSERATGRALASITVRSKNRRVRERRANHPAGRRRPSVTDYSAARPVVDLGAEVDAAARLPADRRRQLLDAAIAEGRATVVLDVDGGAARAARQLGRPVLDIAPL